MSRLLPDVKTARNTTPTLVWLWPLTNRCSKRQRLHHDAYGQDGDGAGSKEASDDISDDDSDGSQRGDDFDSDAGTVVENGGQT